MLSDMQWLQTALYAPFYSLQDFMHAGGWVLKWIVLVALLLWVLVIERYWYLWRIYPAEQALRHAQWQQRHDQQSWTARQIRTQLRSELKLALDAPLPLIRVVVPLSPLLGLLGTVTGMLEVFDAMALHGNGGVRAMAAGVSHAMVSTLAGLVVSLVALLFYTHIKSCVQWEYEQLKTLFPST